MEYWDITIDALRACVGISAAAYALSGLGLNLQFGFTGLLNLGHAGSMMVGAYGVGVSVEHGLPLGVGVIVGVVAALLTGIILGFFTLRLRYEYLAIITIAFAEILRTVIKSSWAEPLTGGVFGIQSFADAFYNINPVPSGDYGVGDFIFTERSLWLMLVAWSVVLIIAYLLYRAINSPWGRVLKSIREDEDLTRSLGKNVFLYKIQSLALGGTLGAMGGIILAIDQQNIHPDFFMPLITFQIYVLVIIGGTSRVWGPVAGAIAFWFIFEWLNGLSRLAIDNNWFGPLLQSTDAGPMRQILVGLGLIALLIFRPGGILGKAKGAAANA